MTALVELVVMDEFGIRPLCPAARGRIDFVGEGAHGDRDRDAPDVEEASSRRNLRGVPVEARRGDRGVRQPIERDVVERRRPGSAPPSFHRRRVRSCRNCGCRDPASRRRGRPANPRFRKASVAGSTFPGRRPGRACRNHRVGPTHVFHRPRDRRAPGRQPKAPLKHRLEPWPPYWCECRAIPAAAAAPSPRRRHSPNPRPAPRNVCSRGVASTSPTHEQC